MGPARAPAYDYLMGAKYALWIEAYLVRNFGDVWMKCLEACEEMSQAFPELRMVKGIAVSSVSRKRWCHCWCVAPDGTIIDPTVVQFGGIPVVYEPPGSGAQPTRSP